MSVRLSEISPPKPIRLSEIEGPPTPPGFVNRNWFTKPQHQPPGFEASPDTSQGRVQEFKDATARGLANVGSGMSQGAAGFLNLPTPGNPYAPAMKKSNQQAIEKANSDAALLWNISKDPEIASKNKDLASKALNLIGETIPYITGTTAAFIAAGPAGAFAVGSLVEGNSAYRTALDDDVDPEKAKKIGIGVGIVSGAIESFGGKGTEMLLNKATAKLKGKIARGVAVFGTGTIVEALEEAGQEVAAITGEETYRDVDWSERVNRTLSAAAGGAFLGGTMKGASMAGRGMMQPPAAPTTSQTDVAQPKPPMLGAPGTVDTSGLPPIEQTPPVVAQEPDLLSKLSPPARAKYEELLKKQQAPKPIRLSDIAPAKAEAEATIPERVERQIYNDAKAPQPTTTAYTPEIAQEKMIEIAGYKANPVATFETMDAPNLLENYWREHDERQAEINRDAVVNQQNIAKAIRKRTYDPGYDKESENVSLAMMVYIDLKEHPTGKDFLSRLSKSQREIYEMSQTLPLESRKIADNIIMQNRISGQLGIEQDVLKNARENYIAHLWEKPQTEVLQARFAQNTARAKGRTLEGGILEGWAKGMNLRVKDVTLASQIAREQVNLAAVGKQMLKSGKKWGLMSEKQLEGFEPVEHPGFTTWKQAGKVDVDPQGKISVGDMVRPSDRNNIGKVVAINGNGADVHFINKTEGTESTKSFPLGVLKPVRSYGKNFFITDEGNLMERVPIYAEPKLAKRLNNIFSSSSLYKIPGVKTLTKYNAEIKAAVLFTSLYHHQAYLRSYAFGSKGLNPIEAYKKGKQAILNMTPEYRLLVRNGLTIGRIQDYDPRMLEGEQTIWGRAMSHFAPTEAARKEFVKLRNHQQRFLFNKLGPFLKVQAAILELRAGVKHNEAVLRSGEMSIDDVAKAVADLMNNDFGGLHLGRMGRNQTVQHLFRLVCLAPDWTESNVRSMVAAFKGGETGRIHRAFWGRIAAKGLGATVLFNLLLASFDDDDFEERYKKAWEEGHLRWLDVDITPIYRALGGTNDKEKYFSLIGHFRDPVKFIVHPMRSAKHKSSIIGRIATDAWSGTDWAGRDFTSVGELVGLSGDTKGRLVKWTPGGGKVLRPSQIPSFIIYQGRSALPIPAQNTLAFLSGEMDAFDAITKSAGLMTATTHPPRPENRRTRKRRSRPTYR